VVYIAIYRLLAISAAWSEVICGSDCVTVYIIQFALHFQLFSPLFCSLVILSCWHLDSLPAMFRSWFSGKLFYQELFSIQPQAQSTTKLWQTNSVLSSQEEVISCSV
jgi:hypothetical protein